MELIGTQILKGSDGWRKWVAGKNWRSPRNTMRPSAMNWNMGFGVGACSRTGPWVPSVFGLSEACAVLLWLAEDLEGRNEEEDIDCFESSVISVQSKLLTPVISFFFFLLLWFLPIYHKNSMFVNLVPQITERNLLRIHSFNVIINVLVIWKKRKRKKEISLLKVI